MVNERARTYGCAAKAPPSVGKMSNGRFAVCNRPAGHQGDHKAIRVRDFTVEATWPREGYTAPDPTPKQVEIRA